MSDLIRTEPDTLNGARLIQLVASHDHILSSDNLDGLTQAEM